MIRRHADQFAEIGIVAKCHDGTKHFFHGKGIVRHDYEYEDMWSWDSTMPIRSYEQRVETAIDWYGPLSEKRIAPDDGLWC